MDGNVSSNLIFSATLQRSRVRAPYLSPEVPLTVKGGVCFLRRMEAGQPLPNWLQEYSTLGLAAKGGVIFVGYNEKVTCRVVS